MTVALLLFYFFVVTAVGSAVVMVFTKNVFKCALWFLVCLLTIAALFVMSFAEFVAVTQILIYAGGVLVIILFGIMFTSSIASKSLHVENTNVFSGSLAGILIFGFLAKLILKNLPVENQHSLHPQHAVETIGKYLITDYSLPFEIVGILLLVALIGASVVTAFMKQQKS